MTDVTVCHMKDRKKQVVEMGGHSGATNTANDSDKRGPATNGSDAVSFWEWTQERWICVRTNPCERGVGPTWVSLMGWA